MRQIILVFLGCAVLTSAKPVSVDGNATITDPENLMPNMNDDGSWSYGYKTSNNIEVHHESADNNDIQRGEYSYIDPDGRLIQVIWMAGAGIGFVPQSNVIDEAIVQSIELNLKNPPEGHDDEKDGKKAAPKKPTPPLNKVNFDKPEHKKVDRPAKAVETTKKYNEISRKEGARQIVPEPRKPVQEPPKAPAPVEDVVEEVEKPDETEDVEDDAEERK